jgi:hypothetical protein
MRRRLMPLLVLLAALGAGGYWNYQRNLAKENAEPRPFRGYSEADLQSLVAAYQGEVQTHQKRYEAARATERREGQGQLLDEKVRDFERASARSQAIRAAGGDLAEREAALADLRKELARRSVSPLQVHLKRLLTF